MTELLLKIDSTLSSKRKNSLLEEAAQLCTGVIVTPDDTALAQAHNIQKIISEKGGTIHLVSLDSLETGQVLGEVATPVTITNRGDEQKAISAAEKGAHNIIVTCPNWKIIPLENLIAQLHGKAKLLAQVSGVKEAKVAAETLELGVDGLILEIADPTVLRETIKELKQKSGVIDFLEVEVRDIKILTSGARVCIDTVSLMKLGEGILVGSQSSGLFLIQAETIPNPHVEPRPFRVNAGPVSSYLLTPEGKTKYLSELNTGDEVLVVDRAGNFYPTSIGRVKIELRPLLLVEAVHDDQVFKVVLQNAETIHLVTKHSSIAVTDLKPGDKVLLRYQPGGRHFGELVEDETVIER